MWENLGKPTTRPVRNAITGFAGCSIGLQQVAPLERSAYLLIAVPCAEGLTTAGEDAQRAKEEKLKGPPNECDELTLLGFGLSYACVIFCLLLIC